MRIALADGLRIWKHILRDNAVPSDVAMRSDAAELMNAGKSSDRRMIFDGHVPRQRGRIRHDDVITQQAVVAYMHVSHQKIVISDSRVGAAALCSSMNIHVFAKDVVIADGQK